MISILSLGIFLKCFKAAGSNTIPEKMILSEATWNADRCSNPSFIMIKLLPQMIESRMNMNQFKKPLPNFFIWRKVAAFVLIKIIWLYCSVDNNYGCSFAFISLIHYFYYTLTPNTSFNT